MEVALTVHMAFTAYTVSNMPTYIALWLEHSKNIAHNGKSSWVQFFYNRTSALVIVLMVPAKHMVLNHVSNMQYFRVSQKID